MDLCTVVGNKRSGWDKRFANAVFVTFNRFESTFESVALPGSTPTGSGIGSTYVPWDLLFSWVCFHDKTMRHILLTAAGSDRKPSLQSITARFWTSSSLVFFLSRSQLRELDISYDFTGTALVQWNRFESGFELDTIMEAAGLYSFKLRQGWSRRRAGTSRSGGSTWSTSIRWVRGGDFLRFSRMISSVRFLALEWGHNRSTGDSPVISQ